MNRYSEALTCIIDRFESGKAVLKFRDNQELVLPKRFLPSDCQEGDVLNVELLTQKATTARRENLAKAILKEILNQ